MQAAPVCKRPMDFRRSSIVPFGGYNLSRSQAPSKPADASNGKPRSERSSRRITEKEADDVEELSSPRTPVIYEIVRRLGDEEMDRPITSLWWSGIAAGLSISFSLLAQGILQAHLPEAPWRLLAGQPRLFRWIFDGRDVAPAAVHGKHRHRGASRHGQAHAHQSLAARPALGCGASCRTWPAP